MVMELRAFVLMSIVQFWLVAPPPLSKSTSSPAAGTPAGFQEAPVLQVDAPAGFHFFVAARASLANAVARKPPPRRVRERLAFVGYANDTRRPLSANVLPQISCPRYNPARARACHDRLMVCAPSPTDVHMLPGRGDEGGFHYGIVGSGRRSRTRRTWPAAEV